MPEDSQIFFSAPRLVKDLDRETSHISASFGLTFPQFMVMEALLHKDQMTVGEIQDTILSTKGTIPVIINNLVRMGMVRRSKDPEDGRKSLIQLTDEGRSLIERVQPVNEKMFTQRLVSGRWRRSRSCFDCFPCTRKHYPLHQIPGFTKRRQRTVDHPMKGYQDCVATVPSGEASCRIRTKTPCLSLISLISP